MNRAIQSSAQPARTRCYAYESHRRAATSAGAFAEEIVPLEIALPDGSTVMHRDDEGVRADASLVALAVAVAVAVAGLKPLAEGGLLTAGTSSQNCDAIVDCDGGPRSAGALPSVEP